MASPNPIVDLLIFLGDAENLAFYKEDHNAMVMLRTAYLQAENIMKKADQPIYQRLKLVRRGITLAIMAVQRRDNEDAHYTIAGAKIIVQRILDGGHTDDGINWRSVANGGPIRYGR